MRHLGDMDTKSPGVCQSESPRIPAATPTGPCAAATLFMGGAEAE